MTEKEIIGKIVDTIIKIPLNEWGYFNAINKHRFFMAQHKDALIKCIDNTSDKDWQIFICPIKEKEFLFKEFTINSSKNDSRIGDLFLSLLKIFEYKIEAEEKEKYTQNINEIYNYLIS